MGIMLLGADPEDPIRTVLCLVPIIMAASRIPHHLLQGRKLKKRGARAMSLFVKVCLHRFESNHINITLPTVGTVPYFTGGFFDVMRMRMRCDTIPTWFRPVNSFFIFLFFILIISL